MTPASRRLIVLCVAVVAGAGAAAYVLTGRPGVTTAPAPLPAPPPSAAAAPAASSLGATPAPEAAAGSTMQFRPYVKAFTLTRDDAAYASAGLDGPQLYPLRAGTAFVSASQSADGNWIMAMTEDGQPAFIPAAGLGPYDPSKAPLPELVEGNAAVSDTARVTVGGTQVSLAGVIGQAGDYASQMQSFIDKAGAGLSCRLQQSSGYTCKLADGTDIARMALFNGGAKAADDASADYRAQEAAARAGHRGMWQE